MPDGVPSWRLLRHRGKLWYLDDAMSGKRRPAIWKQLNVVVMKEKLRSGGCFTMACLLYLGIFNASRIAKQNTLRHAVLPSGWSQIGNTKIH